MNSMELAKKIRRASIEMTHMTHASHIGSALSVADIIAVLYADIVNVFPNDSRNDARDRVILSKGHSGMAIYAALAELDFFSKEELMTYYQDGSKLSGHVSHKGVPGVEVSTGSLGHGIGIAVGMALAARLDDKKHRVFVIIGDGESEEGSVWEAAEFAAFHRLNNLTVIVDYNKMQAMGDCDKQIYVGNLAEKWRQFGFRVVECNGHIHEELRKALLAESIEKPKCVIAHTIKGKGVSFMENELLWHYRDPQGEWYEKAVKELEEG
ncbi:MAG: transketolase [Blautia sp.]|nr:transketolase [Blautia sp.]MCM1200965.1 transketolase [Bacteroides fragilis]